MREGERAVAGVARNKNMRERKNARRKAGNGERVARDSSPRFEARVASDDFSDAG